MGGLEERIKELEGRVRENPSVDDSIKLSRLLIKRDRVWEAITVLERARDLVDNSREKNKLLSKLASAYFAAGDDNGYTAVSNEIGSWINDSSLFKITDLLGKNFLRFIKYTPMLTGVGVSSYILSRDSGFVASGLFGIITWYLARRTCDLFYTGLFGWYDHFRNRIRNVAENLSYRRSLPLRSLFMAGGLVTLESILSTTTFDPISDFLLYDFGISCGIKSYELVKSLAGKKSLPPMLGTLTTASIFGYTALEHGHPFAMGVGLKFGLLAGFLVSAFSLGVSGIFGKSARKNLRHRWLRYLDLRKHNLEGALEHQEVLIENAGTTRTKVLTILEKAGMFLDLGRDNEALQYYQKAIDIINKGGNNVFSYRGFVSDVFHLGEFATVARNIFSIKPDFRRLGYFNMAARNYLKAAENFGRAAELDDNKSHIFYLLASLEYDKARKKDKAHQMREKAAGLIVKKLKPNRLRSIYGGTVFVCDDPVLKEEFVLKNDENENLKREDSVLGVCERLLSDEPLLFTDRSYGIHSVGDREFIMLSHEHGETLYDYLLRTRDLKVLKDAVRMLALMHNNLSFGDNIQDNKDYVNEKLKRLSKKDPIVSQNITILSDLVEVLSFLYEDKRDYVFGVDPHTLNHVVSPTGRIGRIDVGGKNERVHRVSDLAKLLFLGRPVLRSKEDYQIVDDVVQHYKKSSGYDGDGIHLAGMAPLIAIRYGSFAVNVTDISIVLDFMKSAYRNAKICLDVLDERYSDEFNLEDMKVIRESRKVFESLSN